MTDYARGKKGSAPAPGYNAARMKRTSKNRSHRDAFGKIQKYMAGLGLDRDQKAHLIRKYIGKNASVALPSSRSAFLAAEGMEGSTGRAKTTDDTNLAMGGRYQYGGSKASAQQKLAAAREVNPDASITEYTAYRVKGAPRKTKFCNWDKDAGLCVLSCQGRKAENVKRTAARKSGLGRHKVQSNWQKHLQQFAHQHKDNAQFHGKGGHIRLVKAASASYTAAQGRGVSAVDGHKLAQRGGAWSDTSSTRSSDLTSLYSSDSSSMW